MIDHFHHKKLVSDSSIKLVDVGINIVVSISFMFLEMKIRRATDE